MKLFEKLAEHLREVKFTYYLIAAYLFGTLFVMSFPGTVDYFANIPERLSNLLYWYTPFSSMLLHVDIRHFLQNSILILLIATIVERHLNGRILIIVILISTITSSSILSTSDSDLKFMGGNFVYYGYIGSLMATCLKFRKKFSKSEKIITGLFFIPIVLLCFEYNSILYQAMFGAFVSSFIYCLYKLGFKFHRF